MDVQMPVFFFKSLLSLFTLLAAFVAMFTMFEILGRSEKRFNIERLKRIHKINGVCYLLLFLFITYFCLDFIIRTKIELSPRATFHAVFALTIIVLIGVKISFIKVYRQFYGYVKTLGLLIALITFAMVGTSGGYYLLITKFGTDDKTFAKTVEEKKFIIKTDAVSISKGKGLYEDKCSFCHDPFSAKTIVGPGHKGILKNPTLPVSGKPATPENIANQLKNPFKDMPSFSYLSDNDVLNIIAFLNTL